jgi:hypothetical protein
MVIGRGRDMVSRPAPQQADHTRSGETFPYSHAEYEESAVEEQSPFAEPSDSTA